MSFRVRIHFAHCGGGPTRRPETTHSAMAVKPERRSKRADISGWPKRVSHSAPALPAEYRRCPSPKADAPVEEAPPRAGRFLGTPDRAARLPALPPDPVRARELARTPGEPSGPGGPRPRSLVGGRLALPRKQPRSRLRGAPPQAARGYGTLGRGQPFTASMRGCELSQMSLDPLRVARADRRRGSPRPPREVLTGFSRALHEGNGARLRTGLTAGPIPTGDLLRPERRGRKGRNEGRASAPPRLPNRLSWAARHPAVPERDRPAGRVRRLLTRPGPAPTRLGVHEESA